MKALAFILLAGVFIAHDSANWIAAHSSFTPAAVFYMLQGAWTVVLSACLLAIVWESVASIWRDLTLIALAISIVEGLQIPVCRLAIEDIGAVPRGVNLCDFVTGLPVGATLTTLYALLIFWRIGSHLGRKD